MMYVSEQTYLEIRYQGDKYMRHSKGEEWYIWQDYSWVYLTWANSLHLEEMYQYWKKQTNAQINLFDIDPFKENYAGNYSGNTRQ